VTTVQGLVSAALEPAESVALTARRRARRQGLLLLVFSAGVSLSALYAVLRALI
jgi:hypothetical protein